MYCECTLDYIHYYYTQYRDTTVVSILVVYHLWPFDASCIKCLVQINVAPCSYSKLSALLIFRLQDRIHSRKGTCMYRKSSVVLRDRYCTLCTHETLCNKGEHNRFNSSQCYCSLLAVLSTKHVMCTASST
jgi:hypothetical protein